MTRTLHIQMLGGFGLSFDGKPAPNLAVARAESLIALLVLRGDQAQSRQHIAFLFWPDSSEQQARTNLRKLLHHIRRRIPELDEYLDHVGATIKWRLTNGNLPFSLDVAHFDAACRNADSTSSAAAAVAKYTGDLLPSCYDDWIIPERERLASQFHRLLEQTVELHESAGLNGAALRYARRILGQDPLDESAYRRLMRLYAASGGNAGVERTFQACVAALEQELGVQPDTDTQELYSQLTSVAPGRGAATDATPPSIHNEGAAPYRQDFVGRGNEMSVLVDKLRLAARGVAVAAAMTGEAGIGKTRLLHRFVARAEAEGALVLHGGASEAEGMPPYLPLIEALGRYVESAPLEVLRAQTASSAPVLRDVLPQLVARLGDVPESYVLAPEHARLRLYDAVVAFIVAIAADQRVLILVLDDLQWMDSASADLLCHIARAQPNTPLLILAAYRASDIHVNPALQRAMAEMNRLRLLTTIKLGPLSPTEIGKLAESYLGADAVPEMVELLHRQSDGNPFFAEELLRGWSETGVLSEVGATWDSDAAHAASPPASLVTAVHYRLTRISPDAVEQLQVGAIAGRTFSAQVLGVAQDLDADLVEDVLVEACVAGLITTTGNREFTFSHDTVRESIYTQLNPVVRRRLHLALGRALEALADRADAGRLDSITFHFTHGGDQIKGVAYAQKAAEHALRSYAADEAVRYYQTALALLAPQAPNRPELLLGLGDAALLRDSEQLAIEAYTEAQGLLLAAGDPVEAARAARGAGLGHWRLQQLWLARQSLETALSLVSERTVPLTVQVLLDLTNLLGTVQVQIEEGTAYGRRAVETAHRIGVPDLEAAATGLVGYLLATNNDRFAGLELIERAVELSVVANRLSDAAEYCAYLANAHYWSANIDAARRATERRIEFARRCHESHHLVNAHSYLAFLHVHRGEWSEAEQLLANTGALAETLSSPVPRAFILQIRGLMAYHRGAYDVSRDYLLEAVESMRASGNAMLTWELSQLGVAYAALGDRPATLKVMAELEEAVHSLPAGTVAAGTGAMALSIMAIALNDRVRALGYHSRLHKRERLFEYFLVDRVLGTVEIEQGNLTASELHLFRAEETARRGGLRPELARVLVARAELEIAQEEPARLGPAAELLERAVALCRELRMDADLASAQRKLHALRGGGNGTPASPDPFPAHPNGLTDREVDVLRRVAEGKTNRQIAVELGLSDRTVSVHLRALGQKTGANDRRTMIAFAYEHTLVRQAD